jgi:hypothetical protein
MNNTDSEIKRALELPDASQICLAVWDLNKAIKYCEQVLGIGPFVLPEVHYTDKFYLGKPVPDSDWVMGFASLGPIELELSQPVKGPSIYQDFLEQRGEGLHHIGFDIKDLDAKLARCEELGIKILCTGRTPTGGFAHLDTAIDGAPLIELIQRTARRA